MRLNLPGRDRCSWWTFLIAAVVAVWLGVVPLRPASHQENDRSTGTSASTSRVFPAVFVERGSGEPAYWVRTSDLDAEFRPGGIAFVWRGSRIDLRFEGAAAGAAPEGISPTGARIHVLNGPDVGNWQVDRPAWSGVRYRELYPGIEVTYRVEAGRLKSEFVVSPGGDPGQIRMRYSGVPGVAVGARGELRVATAVGILEEDAPIAWQERGGRREAVSCRFDVRPDGGAGFAVGPHDPSRPLWIDPTISYATFVGGSRSEAVTAVAADGAGNAYAAGWTESSNFPVASAASGFRGSVDAFVAKFDPGGVNLLWAVYLGGAGDDRALAIDLDPAGNVYVAGYTASTNFPIVQALQTGLAGGRDVFVAKLNPAGNQLIYSTYYGGGANDVANGLAVDPFGQAYVAGETESANFPTRFPFQATLRGARDAFTFKVGVNGAISYSTFLGGTGEDRATAIAVSANLTPYLTGCTTSKNFPVRRAQQAANAGGQDAWIVRFDGDAFVQVYSTYLGGSGGATGSPECANAIALDGFNNAYVTGVTSSKNFPVSSGFQTGHGGSTLDAFVTKVNSDGVRLYSSYLGGKGLDWGTSIRVDANRRAYVGGYTASSNFPSVTPVQAAPGGGYDGFVVRVDTAGTSLNFASYLGGGSGDSVLGIAFRSPGDLYVGGSTSSAGFPTQAPFQEDLAGALDGFVVRLTDF